MGLKSAALPETGSRRLVVWSNGQWLGLVVTSGCETRQLWADGLPVAWGNLAIFTRLEVTIKSRFFDSFSRQNHGFFTHLSRFFCWHHQILIEEWNQSLMLPKKWSWMHGLIWLWIIFSRWSIVSILSLSHVSNLMMHRECRHDQSTSFESTLWKGSGKRALCEGAS